MYRERCCTGVMRNHVACRYLVFMHQTSASLKSMAQFHLSSVGAGSPSGPFQTSEALSRTLSLLPSFQPVQSEQSTCISARHHMANVPLLCRLQRDLAVCTHTPRKDTHVYLVRSLVTQKKEQPLCKYW